MKPTKITIKMPKRYLAKWLKALRAGEKVGYEQAYGTLYNPANKTFCCLGVLQHCLTGGVEHDAYGKPEGIPSLEWLKDWGIEFLSKDGAVDELPHLFALDKAATEANDEGIPFAKLADAIEAGAIGL